MPVTIDLSGHRALVTGAGQNVGRGIARTLAEAGAEVLVNDLVPDRAHDVAGEIEAAGGRALPAPFDVTEYGAVHEALHALGAIDILVNNAGNAGAPDLAGSFDLANFVDTDPDTWDRYVRINFYGVLNCVHVALPGMIDGGWGRVITLISDSARAGDAHTAVYGGSKAAAAGFMRAIAREVGRHQITANCVSLATMNTRGKDAPAPSGEEAEYMARILKQYIVRRRGEPDDVAAMVCFLASDLSSWITGQTYPVNGGYTLSL
ncbi:MAG TPA: SDR family NAD(P)-dependent oxidoreductase [Acidimicrobiia bacterium]|nr:SDR family NAD(P)-dependent oxidoreductase [Acidimicrobiia bacterium]